MILLLFLSLLSSPDSSSVNWKLQREMNIRTAQFTLDGLGHLYCINKDEITKYGPTGDSITTQSFKQFGWITALDVTNALRPVLFYRDLNRLVVLDNTLSIQGDAVFLEKLGLTFTRLICQSPNNQNIWAYDSDEFRLLRLDRNFQTINNSGNITQIIGKDFSPVHMQEWGNYLFISDPEVGIVQWDMFATYYKTIPLKGIQWFQVQSGAIWYLKENRLFRYDLMEMNSVSYPLPLNDIKSFRISEKNKLFLQTQSGIFIYSAD